MKPVCEQTFLRELLQSEFEMIKSRNSAYSLRSYAKKLGINSGVLSQIFNGKRRVSSKFVNKIIDSLDLDPVQKDDLQVRFTAAKNFTYEKIIDQSLTMDQFNLVADGTHFAVKALIRTQGFKYDIEWMAYKLRKSQKEIREAIERLLKLNMIVEVDGTLKSTGISFNSPDEIASTSIKRHHTQALEEAKESLYRDDVEIRDFTTLTMSIDTRKMKEAKALIRKFRKDMTSLMTGVNTDAVYKFGIQLYPLTIEEDPIEKRVL